MDTRGQVDLPQQAGAAGCLFLPNFSQPARRIPASTTQSSGIDMQTEPSPARPSLWDCQRSRRARAVNEISHRPALARLRRRLVSAAARTRGPVRPRSHTQWLNRTTAGCSACGPCSRMEWSPTMSAQASPADVIGRWSSSLRRRVPYRAARTDSARPPRGTPCETPGRTAPGRRHRSGSACQRRSDPPS